MNIIATISKGSPCAPVMHVIKNIPCDLCSTAFSSLHFPAPILECGWCSAAF